MSQLLEYTKKMTKNGEKKSRKIIFGSELFEPNNEPNFSLYQNIDKNRETKIEKLFWGQNCLNNEPTFGIHQKMTKNREKNQKINFSGQNCLKIFEFLTPTKLTKIEKKIENNYFWLRIV